MPHDSNASEAQKTAHSQCTSGCKSSCDGSTYSSGTTSGGTSGTTSGATSSAASAKDICLAGLTNLTGDMYTKMKYNCLCNYPPVDASCSSSSSTSSTGGTSCKADERGFFTATWKRADGSQFGGSLACKADKTDCHEFTESGPVITLDKVVGTIGNPTSCYQSYGSAGSYPAAGSYSYWSHTKQRSFPLTSASDCNKLVPNDISADELSACFAAIGGGGGSQWSTGSYGYPSGGSMMDRCRTGAKGVQYGSARYRMTTDGPETSGPIKCAGFDEGPCYLGTSMGGTKVIVSSYAGAPQSCDTESTGGYTPGSGMSPYNCKDSTGKSVPTPNEAYTMVNGRAQFPSNVNVTCDLSAPGTPTGGGQWGNACPSGTYNYWSSAKNKSFCVKDRAECDANSEIPPGEKSWCYSATGYGTGGGMYGAGSRMPCTFDNGKVIYCMTPNVDCAANADGSSPLTSKQVGDIGPNCRFGSGGGYSTPCGPDSSFGRETQGISGSDPRYKAAEQKYGCGSYNTGGGGVDQCVSGCNASFFSTDSGYSACKAGCYGTGGGGGYQGSNKCMIDMCKGDPRCMAPSYTVECNSKECMNNANCHPVNYGGGGGGDYEKVQCYPPVPTCDKGNLYPCPAVMPRPPQWRTKSECDRDGWTIMGGGGGDNWVRPDDLTAPRMRFLENLQQQAGEMARMAKQTGVNVGDLGNAYLQNGQTCANNAKTYKDVDACYSASNQQAQAVWDKIRLSGMDQQFRDVEMRIAEMKKFAGQSGSTELQGIVTEIVNTINAVKAAMASNTATPEMTRTDKIFKLEGEFWRIAETASRKGGGDYYGPGGDAYGYVNYADECARIQQKMQYVGKDDYGLASKLQDYYEQCIGHTRDAVSGRDFDEGEFDDNYERFEETYDKEVYEQNACAMADNVLGSAGDGLEDAPNVIAKVKNADAREKLNALLAKGQALISRAYGHRQQGKCKEALTAMQDLENLGNEADAILRQAGNRKGFEMVSYDEQYENVTDRVEKKLDKSANIDMKDFKRHMEKSGYKGAELAAIETMASNPEFLENLLAFASNSAIVKAAANADISTVKLEAIIAENTALKQRADDLEAEVKNLKTGVRTIVESIKSGATTFNSKVAKKVDALLEVASTLPEKEFKTKFEQYVEESNEQNYADGIDPAKDVHTFDAQHAWMIDGVKKGLAKGYFKGTKPGVFDPSGKAAWVQVATVFARHEGVEEGADIDDSPFAKNAAEWGQEAVAGVDELLQAQDTDLATVLGTTDAGKTATRLPVAHLIAALYSDVLGSSDTTGLDCTDISATDLEEIAPVINAGVMSCRDGKFDPNTEFNRAQFATVMERIDGLSDDGTALADEDEDEDEDEDDEGGTATFSNTHGAAAETGDKPFSEPTVEPEPAKTEPAKEPDFRGKLIPEPKLKVLAALTASFVAQNGKLGLTKEAALRVSIMTALSKGLANTQSEKFDKWRKENMPEEWIAKQTVDLENMLTAESLAMLRDEIVPGAGFLMQ